jgi:putative tryptophan/tyrosine transport system substrate-binding protein
MTRVLSVVMLIITLLAAPLAAEAQPAGKVARIGFLSSGVPPIGLERLTQGLRELGYVEGRNIVIESRFAELRLDRLPALAGELVRLNVDVLVTLSTPAALAAKQATSRIPIVMSSGGDPIGSGLVASLARPGGNVTGLTHLAGPEMQHKVLELMKETVPKVSRVGVITNSTIPPEVHSLRAMQTHAPALGLMLIPTEVRSPGDFVHAFAAMLRARVEAVFAFESPLNSEHRGLIVEFAAQNRLPTAFGRKLFVEAGGLMSYGADQGSLSQRAAYHVDKILRGAKPGDLHIEQPTKFDLVINLKTAKALGLTIPPAVLARADEVIQ